MFICLRLLTPDYWAEVVKTRVVGQPSVWLIAAVALINPLYEELIYLAHAFQDAIALLAVEG